MTWTSAVGRSCKWLLYKIVHGLALTKISPNALTFIGLLINVVAGILFGYARPENQQRMFLYAGLVIIGAGIFDMVDGRVARATNQVTQFGGFFDSIIDRYSDVVLFFGLLVYYARANRFFYVVLTAFVLISSVMVSYARARAESLIAQLQSRIHGAPGAHCAGHHRRAVQQDGAGDVGDRRDLDHHRGSSHQLHLAAYPRDGNRPGRPRGVTPPLEFPNARLDGEMPQ